MKLNDEFISQIMDKWNNMRNIESDKNIQYIFEEIKRNPKYKNVTITPPIKIDDVSSSTSDSVTKIGAKIRSPELDNLFPCLERLLKICETRTNDDIYAGFYFVGSIAHKVSNNKIDVYFVSHYQKCMKHDYLIRISQFFEMENKEEFSFVYWKVTIEIE